MSPKVAALVPVGPVTVTSTEPAGSAGAVAVMSPSLLTLNEVAATPPKLTAVAPLNPAPEISTVFPAAVGPALGLTLVTAGTQLNAEPAVDVPLAVVVEMLTGPPDPWGLIASRWWASMKKTPAAGVEPKFT